MDDNSWDESFILHLQEPANNSQQDDYEENDEQDDEEGGKDSDQPAIKTFKEAIASLGEVQHFLERKGQLAVSFEVGSIFDSVAAMQSKSLTEIIILTIFHLNTPFIGLFLLY